MNSIFNSMFIVFYQIITNHYISGYTPQVLKDHHLECVKYCKFPECSIKFKKRH